METIRRQVAIAGRAIDETSKQPIPWARVRLTDGPPAFVQPMVARAKLMPMNQAPSDVTQAYGDLDKAGISNAGRLRAAQIVLDHQLQVPLGIHGKSSAHNLISAGTRAREKARFAARSLWATAARPASFPSAAPGSGSLGDKLEGNQQDDHCEFGRGRLCRLVLVSLLGWIRYPPSPKPSARSIPRPFRDPRQGDVRSATTVPGGRRDP